VSFLLLFVCFSAQLGRQASRPASQPASQPAGESGSQLVGGQQTASKIDFIPTFQMRTTCTGGQKLAHSLGLPSEMVALQHTAGQPGWCCERKEPT